MGRKAGTLLLAALLALVLTIAGLGTFSRAAKRRPTLLTITVTINGIQGTVNAIQPAKGRGANVTLSLHGLEPGMEYEVLGTSKDCSAIDIVDFITWRTTVTPIGDDVFKSERVQRRGPLIEMQSVRILKKEADGSSSEQACSTSGSAWASIPHP